MTWKRKKRCPGLHRVFTEVATAKVDEVSHSQGLGEAIAGCVEILSAGISEGLGELHPVHTRQ